MIWKTLESTPLYTAGLFKLRSDRCELPDGRIMPRYFVLDFPDWVNIVPVTEEGEIILVKQYRQASQKIHLEVPGGSLDPHRAESAEEGARRELIEETGYNAPEMELLASHFPNPALQSNQIHTFLARGCKKVAEQKLDEFEELELYFCSPERLRQHLVDGDINHTIMMASVYKALDTLGV